MLNAMRERELSLRDARPSSGSLVQETAAAYHVTRRQPPGSHWQFERVAYFYADPIDSKPGAPVFNRTVTLKDGWVKKYALSCHF